jgi:hypothetical protein
VSYEGERRPVPREKWHAQPGEKINGIVLGEPLYNKDGVQCFEVECPGYDSPCGKRRLVRLRDLRKSSGGLCWSCSAKAASRLAAVVNEKGSIASNGLKKCASCGETHPVEHFTKSTKNAHRDGLVHHCRKCARIRHLRRTYDFGVSQTYEQFVADHGDVCGVCKKPKEECQLTYGVWEVDHLHGTRLARGILCGHHNRGLGQFQDDPALLRAGADYLERFQKAAVN